MIARNEEGVLAESIESVRPIADEIIILDTGSTDKTAAVAWKHGATLVRFPWRNDFSAARNRCFDLLTGEWGLWLDAGERLLPETAAEVREFVDRWADPKRVYLTTIESAPVQNRGDDGVEGEEIARPRLMPTKAGLRFVGRVREMLRSSSDSQEAKFQMGPGRIIRHPRHHAQAWKTLKADRDLALAALEMVENRQTRPDARILLVEGDAYCSLGMFDQARHAYQSALEVAPRGATEMLEAYYGLVTCYACDPFLGHCQLGVCVEALDVFPVDKQLLLTLGNCLYTIGHIDTAIRAFDTAVRFGKVNPEVWHLRQIDKVAEMCLAAALELGQSPQKTPPPPPLATLPGRLFRIDQQSVQGETPSTHGSVTEHATPNRLGF
jgi:hypothetical protein